MFTALEKEYSMYIINKILKKQKTRLTIWEWHVTLTPVFLLTFGS